MQNFNGSFISTANDFSGFSPVSDAHVVILLAIAGAALFATIVSKF